MQRKATKKTRGANADEKRFQAWCKEQYCCVTKEWLVEVHHCGGATYRHNKVLVGHWFVIPLSEDAHRMYHERKKAFTALYACQRVLWAEQAGKFFGETGIKAPPDVWEAIMDCGK